MASLTNYGERKLLGVLTGTAWSPSLSLALGTDTGTAEVPSFAEVSAGGYARVSLAGQFSAATSTTYVYDPCGTGGAVPWFSRARVNTFLTFPVATTTWNFDTLAIMDGANVISTSALAGPVDPGYRVKVFSPAVSLTLDSVFYVACPVLLPRGNISELGQRKLLDNMTGVTPWTPTPYLGTWDGSGFVGAVYNLFVSAAGAWTAPATDGSGRAYSDLSSDVIFGNVVGPNNVLGQVALFDGAAAAQQLATFTWTSPPGTVTVVPGDNLRVPSGALSLRVTD